MGKIAALFLSIMVLFTGTSCSDKMKERFSFGSGDSNEIETEPGASLEVPPNFDLEPPVPDKKG